MKPDGEQNVKTFSVSINPLIFHNIDEAFSMTGNQDTSADSLLKSICIPGFDTGT